MSGTLKYIDRARELKQAGIDIIDFGVVSVTPQHVKDAAKKMLDKPVAASYTDMRGLQELRDAIADKLKEENKIYADPQDQIIVTVGAKSAIITALLALINPGDDVIIEDPVWVSYRPCVRLAEGRPVPVSLIEHEGWRLSSEAIENRVTKRTKMIIVCNPHNPTGRVLEKSDIEGVIEIAKKYELIVLVDEAYEKYVYDGNRHYSIASFPDMAERTITVQTTSKIFNMFGWRVGWVTGSREIIAQMLKIHSHMIACPTSFAQAGAVAALKRKPLLVLGEMTVKEMTEDLERKRNLMVDGLNGIRDVTCTKGSGAYFAFPNLSRFGKSSMEICEFLLEEAGVLATPGIEFGEEGEGHLRFTYNCPDDQIERGLQRLNESLETLSHPF